MYQASSGLNRIDVFMRGINPISKPNLAEAQNLTVAVEAWNAARKMRRAR